MAKTKRYFNVMSHNIQLQTSIPIGRGVVFLTYPHIYDVYIESEP